jgi:transcriptional regulator with XRE-family HTH domain
MRQTLGSQIRKLRKKKGLKQIEFCKICNISQTYLSQIENDIKQPKISMLKFIAKKIGATVKITIY